MTSGPQMCFPREFVRVHSLNLLNSYWKWCLRSNAGEEGSGGMGVTAFGSGLGGNGGNGGGGGGISGGVGGGVEEDGVEGCKRGIIVQSIAATVCGEGCRRSA
eukprot:scaffold3436_cov42-Attheya_sp.AAC.1